MRERYLQIAQRIQSARWIVASCFAGFAALSLWVGITQLNLTEDISEFIPQNDPQLIESYQQLQLAPHTKKVLILLQKQPEVDVDLNELCITLNGQLKEPWFSSPFKEVHADEAQEVFGIIQNHLHLLLTEQELQQIKQRITDEDQFKSIHRQNLKELMSPEGMFLKEMILNDPLRLKDFSEKKLHSMSSTGANVGSSGALMSTDGTRALLAVDTSISPTDTRQTVDMIQHFNSVWESIQVEGVSADWLSTHRYSYANANSIKRDINRILLVSMALITFVFLLYLREWRALLLLLGPVFVFAFAFGTLALSFSKVSSISIGFASILLGISIDYSLHIYLHARSDKRSKYEAVWEILAPLSLSLLTTILAFTVLLFSSVKTHKEFAVFSIAGLAVAFLFSVFILPAFIRNKTSETCSATSQQSRQPKVPSFWPIGVWALLFTVILAGVPKLRLSSNNSDLYIVPKELKQLEQAIDDGWGEGLRRTGMYYVSADTMEQALIENDHLFFHLSQHSPNNRVVSVHNILPSIETQRQALTHWNQTFDPSTITQLESRLRSISWPTTGLHLFQKRASSFNPVTIDTYGSTFIASLLSNFIQTSGDAVKIYTLTGSTENAVQNTVEDETGANELSASKISRKLNAITISQFRNLVLTTLLAVLLFACLLLRNWKIYIAAMLPMLTGLGCMMGYLGWAHTPLTFFHAASALLIIGLGVDYGILISKMAFSDSLKTTSKAVWISSLTTIAGFVALIFASHPFLSTLGINVTIGVTAAMLTALHVSPRILHQLTKSNS